MYISQLSQNQTHFQQSSFLGFYFVFIRIARICTINLCFIANMTDADTPPKRSGQLKTPKGTRDWVGQDALLRDKILYGHLHPLNFKTDIPSQTITDVFKRHGGIPLDTPVFELRDVLSEKYGEDSRLIYNVEDQGGELCSLRYDLTVPFARWLAMRTDVKQIKRYQIAKVYRRDQPAISRGRLREFSQCDFDIAGTYDTMVPDAEILRVIVEAFRGLGLEIVIKLNHRLILDGLFAVAGVPADKTRPISSAVDKLDKASWAEVKKEMVDEKGLPEDVADRVGKYVQQKGSMLDMLEILKSDKSLQANEALQSGIKEMGLLMTYLQAMDVVDYVSFDMSLARGLDYYTGLIYEVIPKQASQVGSIAAGGRYDNLVGMHGKQAMPCVGLSFGVDRIFTVLSKNLKTTAASNLKRDADVYIIAAGGKEFDGLMLERMAIARELWDADIQAEYSPKVKPKLLSQFNASKDVPLAIILGQDELAAGQVRLKEVKVGGEEADKKDRGPLVRRGELVDEVKRLMASAKLPLR